MGPAQLCPYLNLDTATGLETWPEELRRAATGSTQLANMIIGFAMGAELQKEKSQARALAAALVSGSVVVGVSIAFGPQVQRGREGLPYTAELAVLGDQLRLMGGRDDGVAAVARYRRQSPDALYEPAKQRGPEGTLFDMEPSAHDTFFSPPSSVAALPPGMRASALHGRLEAFMTSNFPRHNFMSIQIDPYNRPA